MTAATEAVSAAERYREELRRLDEWVPYLLENSGLPGPRGNIELARAVAEEGSPALFARLRGFGPEVAPTNSPEEFLAFCGVLGLGRELAEGKLELLYELRPFASDSRWRMREAVAMALQRLGDVDMPTLVEELRRWSTGNRLEQRAAAAALCEPRLLVEPRWAQATLSVLDAITSTVVGASDRRSEEFQALRKGLGYCWSVAAAALPDEGLRSMERWLPSSDPDVRWIMRENLKKKRLERVDAEWVVRWRTRLSG